MRQKIVFYSIFLVHPELAYSCHCSCPITVTVPSLSHHCHDYHREKLATKQSKQTCLLSTIRYRQYFGKQNVSIRSDSRKQRSEPAGDYVYYGACNVKTELVSFTTMRLLQMAVGKRELYLSLASCLIYAWPLRPDR